jgi:catechol 2,3-dioxygenase-like lactoylglutathione lyase family enzyme
MIHSVSLGINSIVRSRAFYDPVLSVLGIRLLNSSVRSADYGVGSLLFSLKTPVNGKPASPGNGVNIAFAAGRRAMVEQFYKVALENGGSDAGAPGLRPEYDANYFRAFVYDADGNKIEAVTFSAK